MDDYKFIVLYEARWITFETGRVVPRHCRDFKGVQWTNICSNPDNEVIGQVKSSIYAGLRAQNTLQVYQLLYQI